MFTNLEKEIVNYFFVFYRDCFLKHFLSIKEKNQSQRESERWITNYAVPTKDDQLPTALDSSDTFPYLSSANKEFIS